MGLGYLACGVVHALSALAFRRQLGFAMPAERRLVKALGVSLLVVLWPGWLVWAWRPRGVPGARGPW